MQVTVYDVAVRGEMTDHDVLWSGELSAPPRVGETATFRPPLSEVDAYFEVVDVVWTLIGADPTVSDRDFSAVDVQVFVQQGGAR